MKLADGTLTIQWFPDNKKANRLAPHEKSGILHGTLEELEPRLRELNRKGAGIYFSVNETNGKGRLKEDITKIRAYMIDVDGISDPDLKKRRYRMIVGHPMRPSLIIETKNGLHLYWYSRGDEPVDNDTYRRVNGRIADAFGGDMKARDISRVMRLPEYLHVKDPNDPFEVILLSERPDLVYTQQELLDAFPATQAEIEAERRSKERTKREKIRVNGDADHARRYVLAALERACDEVSQAQEGGRNDTLNANAFSIAGYLHTGAISEDEWRDAFTAAGLDCGLEETEILETLASAIRGREKNQRSIPEPKFPVRKRDKKARAGVRA